MSFLTIQTIIQKHRPLSGAVLDMWRRLRQKSTTQQRGTLQRGTTTSCRSCAWCCWACCATRCWHLAHTGSASYPDIVLVVQTAAEARFRVYLGTAHQAKASTPFAVMHHLQRQAPCQGCCTGHQVLGQLIPHHICNTRRQRVDQIFCVVCTPPLCLQVLCRPSTVRLIELPPPGTAARHASRVEVLDLGSSTGHFWVSIVGDAHPTVPLQDPRAFATCILPASPARVDSRSTGKTCC